MRIRIWPVLVVGFSAVIALISLSGWLAFVRSRSTYTAISALYAVEHGTENCIAQVRSDIANSAILLRDFLLDPAVSPQTAKARMNTLRASTEQQLARLEGLVPHSQVPNVRSLREQTDAYWSSLDSVLTQAAKDRARFGYSFLQSEIVPRRQSALAVLGKIVQLSSDAFAQRKQEINAQHAGLAFYLVRSIGITVLIALAVAGASLYGTYSLEQTAAMQHRQVQDAEDQLRRLSQQLVRTQEEERRGLSRELHDQVGQILTALRISIGNIERGVDGSDERTSRELDLAKRLVVQALRSTRDLAMGLRPTMLDDLGLEAALEWYARQHARVYGVPVSLHLEAPSDQLSDAQRTCVYRIVQEALNNTAKHAQATNIDVTLAFEGDAIALKITDDGMGFDADTGIGRGLGLLGMRERVTQLGGDISIDAKPRHGTRISARLPWDPGAASNRASMTA